MPSIKALVVDDVQVMRSLLISSLKTLHITDIKEAADAQSALAIFSSGDIDIVFLDINMPGVNGLDLIRQLRSMNPNAFIVMVSGESSLDNVKQSIALGAKGFIVKPYTAARIKSMIDKYRSERSVDLPGWS